MTESHFEIILAEVKEGIGGAHRGHAGRELKRVFCWSKQQKMTVCIAVMETKVSDQVQELFVESHPLESVVHVLERERGMRGGREIMRMTLETLDS